MDPDIVRLPAALVLAVYKGILWYDRGMLDEVFCNYSSTSPFSIAGVVLVTV